MAIYTSNYSRMARYQHPNPIAISIKPPDWYTGRTMPILAPTWKLVNGVKHKTLSEDDYTRRYLKLIRERGFSPTIEMLDDLPDPTFFLCFEGPNEFCHRHIVAKWIEMKTGWCIPEWKNKKEIEAERQSELTDSLLEF